jgi:hypothetical protein
MPSQPEGSRPIASAAGTSRRRQAFQQVGSVIVAIALVSAYVHLGRELPARKPPPADAPAPKAPIATEPIVVDAKPVSPEEAPPPPPPAPEIDRAAVSAAEAELDAASRDRARADQRVAELNRKLAVASAQAALDASRARKLGNVIRDPSSRIMRASTRGGFVKGERDKLAKELSTLRNLPRPKTVSILSKSPVARPAFADEFHFELRRNRVTYINLTRLLDLTKADAQVRIRMADRTGVISARVGPAGSFSMEYELARANPGSMDELMQRRSVRFDLQSWEIIPESENRGESYEMIKNPASDFTRVINKMSPTRSTVTLWVYPDSFALYRRLREDLTEHGFSVAARPLPDGMAIRGSPMGTKSAAQ